MKAKTIPVISDKIFLADTSPAFAAAELADNPEVETNPELRAWVKVRQATTANNRRRADLIKERERKWTGDSEGNVAAVSVVYRDNPVTRRMVEAEMTLAEIGNLQNEKGEPLFVFPIKEDVFERTWMSLDPMYTDAIYTAVLTVNKDWFRQGE